MDRSMGSKVYFNKQWTNISNIINSISKQLQKNTQKIKAYKLIYRNAHQNQRIEKCWCSENSILFYGCVIFIYIYILPHFIQLSVDGYLDWFHTWAVVNWVTKYGNRDNFLTWKCHFLWVSSQGVGWLGHKVQ